MGIKIILLFIIASTLVLIGSQQADAATFLVDSSNDVVDMDGCDGTHCSLREAINEANSNPGLDGINFQGPGPFLILPDGSALPSLTGPVVIDGGGFQVVIDGQNAGLTADGLRLSANGNTIRGLVINNFDGNGIALDGSNSTIEGNKIGTNAAGTIARGNGNNGGSLFKLNGIQVFGSNNLIGGTTPATRNIISGNAGPGLGIFDSSNNVVQGNYIGTDITGTLDLGNFFGVTIGDAPNTLVGGTVAGARNIISGNDALGIHITTFAVALATSSAAEENSTESYETMTADIAVTSATSSTAEENSAESYETTTADTTVTSATRSAAEENSTESYETMTANIAFSSVATNIYDQKYDEIQFSPKTQQTTAHQQIISNDINGSSELSIQEIQVSASFIGIGSNIEGNYIGTDVTGTLDLGNSQGGIQISNVSNTMIGGSFAARNIISGNGDSGFTLGSGITIFDVGATGNVIEGNFIGLDVTGNTALGNSNNGIQIQGGQNNVIGGISPGTSNYISANEGQGILIGDPSTGETQGNIVRRNFIGTDITGTVDLGNGSVGIVIQNGLNNIIGGTTFEHRNHIAGNGGAGVLIIDPLSTGNMVLGNWIGTDITGTVIMPNNSDGVAIVDASNNTVGGTVSGARNIISGNGGNGIFIFDRESFLACCSQLVAFNNKVEGNFIGTDFIGINDLGNTLNGVFIVSSPANTIGGNVTEARNIISGNTQNGIYLTGNLGPNAFGNTIIGNRIGTNELGTTALGNGFAGIRIEDVPNNTVGGNMVADRNLISGNDQNGILILGIQAGGVFASGNKIEGNFIGTDVTGTGGVGNSLHGVFVGGAPGNTIGDLVAGEVNVISGNLQGGIFISGAAADGNTIAGNHIGTDVTGMADLGNTLHGVEIFEAPNTTVGGTNTDEKNIISGNDQSGVVISGTTATGNKIQGNNIGTDITGASPLGNLLDGVFISDAPNNKVGNNTNITPGGACTGGCNLISGNPLNGVTIVGELAIGNSIRYNSIHNNTLLGIDLKNDGVTPNDVPVDADVGPNHLMNFPVIDSINFNGTNTTISGVILTTLGVEQPEIDIYSNDEVDGSGFGEGKNYLDTVLFPQINHFSPLFGSFVSTFPGPPTFPFISSTATNMMNSTSEFGPAKSTAELRIFNQTAHELNDVEEDNPGSRLFLNGKLIQLEVFCPSCDALLQVTTGSNKIKAWDTQTKNNEINISNPLPVNGTMTLWIEGIMKSTAERDVVIELSDATNTLMIPLIDEVNVTVISGDIIIHKALPVQAVDDVSALVKNKLTVFKVEIENTFDFDDYDVPIKIEVDSDIKVNETIHLLKKCKAIFYLPNNVEPTTTCNGQKFSVIGGGGIKPFTSSGFINVQFKVDDDNKIEEEVEIFNNQMGGLREVEDMGTLTLLYFPVKHHFSNMTTPCPVAARDAGGFCSPNLRGVVTADKWMELVYPVEKINYIPIPGITNTKPTMNGFVPGLMDDLIKMKKTWEFWHPFTDNVMLYGWFPTGTMNNGASRLGSFVGYGDESVSGNGKFGDMNINSLILAHEGGHGMKISHPQFSPPEIAQGKPGIACTTFNAPYISLSITKDGYHIPNGNVKPSTLNDFMTGGHCVPLGQEKWISPQGWDRIITLLGGTLGSASVQTSAISGESAIISGESAIISGVISGDGSTGQLEPIFKTQFAQDVTTGLFTLEMLDSLDTVLHTQNFDVFEEGTIAPTTGPFQSGFFFVSPFHNGTAKIQILNGVNVLDSIDVSANTPQVTVVFPNGGETLSGAQTISWTSSDLDGGPLSHSVEYSFDNGTIWNIIANDIISNSTDYDFDLLPGNGTMGLIRVIVSDGINTNNDQSDVTFTVSNKPPLVVIESPVDGVTISSLDQIQLLGEATDTEDGIPPSDSSFSWTDDISGALGTGRTFTVGPFSPGTHQITLAVDDSDLNTGMDTVTIMVTDDIDGDGVLDINDNCSNIANAGQEDLDVDGIGNACDALNVITIDTTVSSTFTLLGNLIVQNNSLLTIPSGVNGIIPSGSLTLQSGGGVLIKNGGTLQVTDILTNLTIIKDPTNDSGGNALPDDFMLTVGGNPVLSEVKNSYNANTPLAIDETQLTGYSFVSITGDAKCPASLGGTITLAEGDDITCTITNNDAELCGPPVSGDWTVTSDCTLSSSDIAPGNVIVQNNALLTIPSGVILDIDLANFDLIINSGGSVLIKEGGLIT